MRKILALVAISAVVASTAKKSPDACALPRIDGAVRRDRTHLRTGPDRVPVMREFRALLSLRRAYRSALLL